MAGVQSRTAGRSEALAPPPGSHPSPPAPSRVLGRPPSSCSWPPAASAAASASEGRGSRLPHPALGCRGAEPGSPQPRVTSTCEQSSPKASRPAPGVARPPAAAAATAAPLSPALPSSGPAGRRLLREVRRHAGVPAHRQGQPGPEASHSAQPLAELPHLGAKREPGGAGARAPRRARAPAPATPAPYSPAGAGWSPQRLPAAPPPPPPTRAGSPLPGGPGLGGRGPAWVGGSHTPGTPAASGRDPRPPTNSHPVDKPTLQSPATPQFIRRPYGDSLTPHFPPTHLSPVLPPTPSLLLAPVPGLTPPHCFPADASNLLRSSPRWTGLLTQRKRGPGSSQPGAGDHLEREEERKGEMKGHSFLRFSLNWEVPTDLARREAASLRWGQLTGEEPRPLPSMLLKTPSPVPTVHPHADSPLPGFPESPHPGRAPSQDPIPGCRYSHGPR